MQETPVLMLTQDAALWRSWQQIASLGWQPCRGTKLAVMQPWRARGYSMVVLDLALPELAQWSDRAWKNHLQGLKVLALSAHLQDAQGQQVLAHGAVGYAHTCLSPESLARILTVLEGGAIWMGRSLLHKLLQDLEQRLPPATQVPDWSKGLSPRETEVAQHAARGQSNEQIAQQLGITERTVRAHLSAVFEKLQVQDRLQLALSVHGIR